MLVRPTTPEDLVDDRPLAATTIGTQLGLSPQETNWLLFNNGILEGEPGAWRQTEKGKAFRVDHFPYRGPGVYNHYPSDYPTDWYDPSIMDELTVTPEVRVALDEQVRAHRAAKAAARNAASEPAVEPEVDEASVDGRPLRVIILGAAGLLLATAGGVLIVRRYGPTWKRKWQEDAVPRLERAKARITGRQLPQANDGEGTRP
jgi:hypothetical protein